MAAYAALVSLINNIEQIKIHPHVSTLFDEKQVKSLLKRVDSLLVFIESYNSYGGSKDDAEDLARQITSAAHSAEDVIESHIVDQILPQDMIQSPIVFGSNIPLVMLDLRNIIQDMDSFGERVMKVEKERGCKVELPPQSSTAAASSRPPTAGKSNMVGFDGYLLQLLDELTGPYKPDRQIIPIVGMGGIGKTTLAKNVYDSSHVVQHFDLRAWVTVCEGYNVRQILLETLSCLRQSNDGMDKKTEHELGELLHKTLWGMRYIIVLDDVWSIEALDEIMFFFPNNFNRSRILVTTRIVDVANCCGSMGLALDYLGDVNSWELFCEKVFPHEDCPAELEEIGKEIVKKCRGLPLAIIVIGGLLGNSSRTKDQWENVAKDMSSTLNMVEDNRCFKLLSLSYNHLPARLKPCFLYLGIFPEDDVMHVSRLVKLWVSEGFIKSKNDQSLEETAESYIKDLVDRNLISVDSFRWSGKVKTFRIHDLLRDLCIRVAEKEKFLCVTSELDTPREMDKQRHVIIRGRITRVYYTLESKSLARSLIFNERTRVRVKPRLLRVLVGVYSGSTDIFQKVNLRYLAQEYRTQEYSFWFLRFPYHLPSSISLLWNVQTMIITRGVERVYAPPEIWKMQQLRHLVFNFVRLPEPPTSDGIVLRNLQTLGRVVDLRFSEEACKRMPNIKKLHVYFGQFLSDSANFASFNKLESLHYELNQKPEGLNLLQYLKFPTSLKKLTLERLSLQWKELTMIGSLPHLEALILEDSMRGSNWDPVEGEFVRLRFLRIVHSDLVCWNAYDTHFPVLENLVLEGMHYLYEIPSDMGYIPTLEGITVRNCSISAAVSAIKILDTLHSFGNEEGLQVKVDFRYTWDLKRFKKHLELEGLTGVNFHVNWRDYYSLTFLLEISHKLQAFISFLLYSFLFFFCFFCMIRLLLY
ncbi:hypothetical protein ACS0TY_006932 [Phlomoides rotata]